MRTARALELFLDDCRYRQLSPKTVDSYGWALRKLGARYPELPEDPEQIKRAIAAQDLAPESRHDLWRNLRAFYRWLKANEYSEDAMASVKAPQTRRRTPRTLEAREVDQLIASNPSRRDRALLSVALDTGARLGELASMTRSSVTLSGIHVEGKTGDRFLPVSPHVLQLLLGVGDSLHVWTGREGRLTRSGVQQAVRRSMYRAGILPPKAGPHLLRHTFGKLYILAGGDVFSLQRIMGHRSLETTMIYVHMNNSDLVAQHARFSPLRDLDVSAHQPRLWRENTP
jgi:site-specific recombinase XerD